jgi:hypothetical protein
MIVIKADLSHSTVEVGLSQPRLGTDNLTEILDGKDVVLKVEGITADGERAVRIDLCL